MTRMSDALHNAVLLCFSELQETVWIRKFIKVNLAAEMICESCIDTFLF